MSSGCKWCLEVPIDHVLLRGNTTDIHSEMMGKLAARLSEGTVPTWNVAAAEVFSSSDDSTFGDNNSFHDVSHDSSLMKLQSFPLPMHIPLRSKCVQEARLSNDDYTRISRLHNNSILCDDDDTRGSGLYDNTIICDNSSPLGIHHQQQLPANQKHHQLRHQPQYTSKLQQIPRQVRHAQSHHYPHQQYMDITT